MGVEGSALITACMQAATCSARKRQMVDSSEIGQPELQLRGAWVRSGSSS
jgi:hypothetical protein